MQASTRSNTPGFLRSADIHAHIGSGWPTILAQLGVPAELLNRKKHVPCPGCGGKDRYNFRCNEEHPDGHYFCRGCGPGDGFKLLQLVFGWSFSETRKRVMEAAGLADPAGSTPRPAPVQREPTQEPPAAPDMRVHRLRKGSCRLEDCDQAVDYLAARGLWPLPAGCTLSAHASAEYYHGPQRIGRFSALLADVRDVNGELVTAHVTYLQGARKLEIADPEGDPTAARMLAARKILSKMDGRVGCAVRLAPATDTLGIAEGIETALSAAMIEGLPVWAALNTSLLAKFEPPPQTQRLVIYADNDAPGLLAAGRLMERLQGRIRFELRVPRPPYKDFNDQLTARARAGENDAPSH